MDLRGQPGPGDFLLVLLRPIRRVRPDSRAGVRLIRKPARYASVMPGGVGDDPCPDEAVAPVGIDMGFAAEYRRGDCALA